MHPVNSTNDVLKLMQIGQANRAIGATALNQRSSRSHSVVTIHVRGTDVKSGTTLCAFLHLVDLAGSERVDRSEVTGDKLKEAQHINKSLSALGDVIFALSQKNGHIPYRNSKLTQVLQSSLGGHAKTLMFVQINPEFNSYSESLSTLKFAERVSGVELGTAHSNKENKDVKDLIEQDSSVNPEDTCGENKEQEIELEESKGPNRMTSAKWDMNGYEEAPLKWQGPIDSFFVLAFLRSVKKRGRNQVRVMADQKDWAGLTSLIGKKKRPSSSPSEPPPEKKWLSSRLRKINRRRGQNRRLLLQRVAGVLRRTVSSSEEPAKEGEKEKDRVEIVEMFNSPAKKVAPKVGEEKEISISHRTREGKILPPGRILLKDESIEQFLPYPSTTAVGGFVKTPLIISEPSLSTGQEGKVEYCSKRAAELEDALSKAIKRSLISHREELGKLYKSEDKIASLALSNLEWVGKDLQRRIKELEDEREALRLEQDTLKVQVMEVKGSISQAERTSFVAHCQNDLMTSEIRSMCTLINQS
ncbi:Kinesin-4 [Apostasia shenzhenica]|uniref:Kinesin-4 n=1 Tax=Apostasia shenzhenica TaxID=1088818 RepID=A0A2I0AE13_9ASPA|nr:Kinesin-4 [Apostasia shenzhenica]